jgi:transcriptional regulator with XRE-family HTH domain
MDRSIMPQLTPDTLKSEREARGLSQRAVARMTGFDQPDISTLERADDMLRQIAAKLSLEPCLRDGKHYPLT